MVTPDSPLVGPLSGTISQAIAYLGTDTGEYLRELWRLCGLVGLDAAILAAQMAHETDDGTSFWWTTRRNPAGIGITGDPAQNDASQTWGTQTDAARGHVAHMLAYVFGDSGLYPGELPAVTVVDKRFRHAIDQSWAGTIRTIRDLTGKWATDPEYHTKLVARHRAIFGAQEVEQPVSTPVFYDLMTDYARFGISQEDAATVRGYRFENRQGSKPSFIVLHIQVGTTRSSLDWWANGYDDNGNKVNASSTVMIQRDGSILRVIPEQHAPWTNGDDNRPTATGQRLVNLPGNSNLHTLSIEAEGRSGAEVLDYPRQLDAIEWQVRDWMNRYDIPLANVIRHGDVNSVDRPDCPGAYYDEIIRRLKTGPTPAPKPKPADIWWERGDVGRVVRASDGWVALAMLVPTYATTKRDVPLYDQIGGVKVGAVKAGKPVVVVGTTRDLTGKGWYLIETPDGFARARGSSFADKLPLP